MQFMTQITYAVKASAKLMLGVVLCASTVACKSIEFEGSSLANISNVTSSISNSRVFVFGEIEEQRWVFKNTGPIDAKIVAHTDLPESGPFHYKDGKFPGTGGNCATLLAPGDECVVYTEFQPESEGRHEVSWTLQYRDGVKIAELPFVLVRQVGKPAFLEVEEGGVYAFPVTESFDQHFKTFTITNTGGLTASGITKTLATGSQFSVLHAQGTCKNTLAPGASCTVSTAFRPQAQGSHTDILSMGYNNAQTTETTSVVLSGVSANIAANITFVGNTTYSFGTIPIGKTLIKKINLVNNGFVEATNLSFATDTHFIVVSTTCTSSLPVAATCELIAGFSPQTSGLLSGSLRANYNSATDVKQTSYSFTGTGVTPGNAAIKLDATTFIPSFDFGTYGVGDDIEAKMYITNTGQFAMESLAIGISGAPFTIVSKFCPAKLNANVSCEINLKFEPSAIQPFNGTLNLTYNNGATLTSLAFPLSGVGASVGVLRFSEAPALVLGQTVIGGVKNYTLTLNNAGLGTASDITIPTLPAGNEFRGGSWPGTGGTCPSSAPFTLAASSSCTVSLTFRPTSRTSYIGNLSLEYNNEIEVIQAGMAIYGEGRDNGSLVFLQSAPYDLGPSALSVPTTFTITVQNPGDYTVSGLAATISGNNAFHFIGGSYPGVNPEQDPDQQDISSYCRDTLDPTRSCNLYLEFLSPSATVAASSIDFTYSHELASNVVVSLPLTAEAKPLAFLVASPISYNAFTFGKTAKGGSKTLTLRITNVGQMPAEPSDLTALASPFNTDLATTNCLSTIAAGAFCDVNLSFSPLINGVTGKALVMTYSDSEFTRTLRFWVNGDGVNPAALLMLPGPANDFGFVVVNSSKDILLTVRNTGGVPATNISFNSLAPPFSVQANNCPNPILAFAQCTINLRFTPTVAGSAPQTEFKSDYENGVGPVSSAVTLDGIGEPPLHLHRDWTKIYAVGDAVNAANFSDGDRSVQLAWNAMTPNAGVMTSYSVYRRTEDEATYDLNSPIAANISLTTRSYTDSTVLSSTVYYYSVRPIIDGFPSRSLSTYSEIKVVVPPANMALIHRRMANKAMCELMGKTPDSNNHNRCTYSSIGNKNNMMDLGYDILVDRFELGQNNTSRYGQLPNAGYTQTEADDTCKLQDGIAISGITNRTFQKTLISRKEHLIASLWPSNLTAAQIIAIQEGTLASTNCNGNSNNLDTTGSNTVCVSRWGIEDMAGNAWEWVSDRIYDGRGVTQMSLRLDVNNTDLDTANFLNLQPAAYLSDLGCLAPALMLPVERNGSICPTDAISTSDFGANNLLKGRYFSPGNSGARFVAVGGSFIKATTYPSIFTTAFLDPSLPIGAGRCGFRLQ